jgi:tRNA threonylcarbamoyl adenosine modification protein (Sua5/YciO/YrdC/YwlC family)
MAAEHLYTFINPTHQGHLDRICRILNNDGVIAYPADINWAFACDATSQKALAKIRQLKSSNSKDQPFTLLCDSISTAAKMAMIGQAVYRILRKILPGDYTVLLASSKQLPKHINDKRKVVGIRIPKSPLIIDIMTLYQKPIVTSSVPEIPDPQVEGNMILPRFGYQVDQYYGHGIDVILDLGEELSGLETSVVDLSDDAPKIVREGAGDLSFLKGLIDSGEAFDPN